MTDPGGDVAASETGEPAGFVVGLDVGGTKTLGAAYDRSLGVIEELQVPTIASGDSLPEQLIEVVQALVDRLEADALGAIGIGMPGLIDRPTGSVRQAVNLGIGERPVAVGPALADAFGVACELDNDVNAAALGAYEMLLAAGEEVTDLAYLSIGTGIAAGIILDRRLHRGRRGVAGEIGHFPIEPGGATCECGLTGCLEAVASGAAIARRWPTSDDRLAAEHLLAEAALGNAAAVATANSIGDQLARAVYLLAITYDVDRIVLGGGVASAGADFLDLVRAGLHRLGRQSDFVRLLGLPDRVSLKPPAEVGALGAAALVSRSLCR